MAAVIRVKRQLAEEPLEALVLNCKRFKRDDEPNNVSAILKFAGTLESQDEDLLSHIHKLSKANAEANFKKHIPDVNVKLKQQIRDATQSSRYKVVNCFRAIDPALELTSALAAASESPTYTVVDIEINGDTENKSSTEQEIATAKPGYVYDLYYTNSDDFGYEGIDNDMFSVYPYESELVFGSARDNGCPSSSEEDSDDSNKESNWRNDYPDSDHSVGDDDMQRAMTRFNIDERSDLSSDAGEENLIYGLDSEGAGFEEEVDQADVWRHGELYAKFKAKMKRTEDTSTSSNLYYGDISDESDHSDNNLDYY